MGKVIMHGGGGDSDDGNDGDSDAGDIPRHLT